MPTIKHFFPVVFAFTLCSPLFAHGADEKCNPDVVRQTNRYLATSSSKDIEGVLSLLDKDKVMFLGTGRGEVEDSVEKVRQLLVNHYQYWTTARFDKMVITSCRASGDLATISFDAPYFPVLTSGETLSLTMRFLMVWKRNTETKEWLLTQSLYSTIRPAAENKQ